MVGTYDKDGECFTCGNKGIIRTGANWGNGLCQKCMAESYNNHDIESFSSVFELDDWERIINDDRS